MPENKLTKEDLEALKQCRSKEEVKKYLSNRQLSEDELDKVSGGNWFWDALWAMLLDSDAQEAINIEKFSGGTWQLNKEVSRGGTGVVTTLSGGTQDLAKGAGNYVRTTIDKIYGKK